ncbi:MAG: hypothetical protein WDN72_08885 [Alphaproteobacteria bacterium]
MFAVLPQDEEVSSVTLLNMQHPMDKISGRLTKAFTGAEHPVSMQHPESVEKALAHDRLFLPRPLKDIPDYRHRLVAPPLETSNSAYGVAQFLYKVRTEHEKYPFDAVIVKVPLRSGWRRDGDEVLWETAQLRRMGVDVFFVNDPVYKRKTNKLEFQQRL